MKPVAIVGAGGFVGTRLAESLVLDSQIGVRAVVRSNSGLAPLCRFGGRLETLVADATDPKALAPTLEGCSAVVNLVTGPPRTIRDSSQTIYQACRESSVARLVHLSSAVVFGLLDQQSVGDRPPANPRLWMPYARAKLSSERFYESVMGVRPPEVTVLRPGLVWGPGSPHTADLIRSLQRKEALLVGDGSGQVNGIYIDNLVACIRACLEYEGHGSGFFNVVDPQPFTWRELLGRLAPHLRFDMRRIARVSAERQPWSPAALVDLAQSSPVTSSLYFWLKERAPGNLKALIKSLVEGRASDRDFDRVASDYARPTTISREMWSLQKVAYRLSDLGFRERFGDREDVTFEEGARRTLSWAAFLGFPIEP